MTKLRELIEAKIKVSDSTNKNIIAKIKYDFVVGEKQNSNKRTYGDDILEKGIAQFDAELKKQKIAGQMNHPIIPGSELDKIGHALTNVSYDKKTHTGTAMAVILNTTSGRDLKVLIDSEIPFGASMRGSGTQDSAGNIKDDWKLNSIDFVSHPSYGSDTMITKANLIESGNSKLGKLSLDEIENAHHESFLSLRDNLSAAVKDKFGNGYWLVDFSPTDVIVRKEDGSAEDGYQKVPYTIKNDEVILGDGENVKKTIDYKKEDEEKMAIKNMTLGEMKKSHPELLKEHEEEMKRKKSGSLYKRFEEAKYSGYEGSFDQYKQLVESYIPIIEVEASKLIGINSFDEAVSLAAEREKEKQVNKPAAEKLLEARYEEAMMSGYSGSFSDWKKRMAAAELVVTAKEQAQKETGLFKNPTDGRWPDEIQQSEKLENEMNRKIEIEQYHEDIKNGLWLGSFSDWLQDKKEQHAEQLKSQRMFTYPS